MTTVARLGAFAVALAAVCAVAIGVGRATGPVGPIGPDDDNDGERRVLHAGTDDHGAEAEEGHVHAATGTSALPGGLASSQDGYTLVPEQATFRPGTRELGFRIDDAEGEPVTAYDVEHDKRMHLVAVRRDLTGFQHVHPELDASGTWRVPLDLTAGSWRVFADFVPAGGDGITLGTDLAVPGDPGPAPRLPVTTTDTVDGYTVDLEGDVVAGEHAMLALTVSRDGVPVTDLQPYLGAYGHLVALREGDLAYLHVHPEDGPAGPTLEFGTEVPSAGRYHLYLDFQHAGAVRTASFTLEVGHGGHDH